MSLIFKSLRILLLQLKLQGICLGIGAVLFCGWICAAKEAKDANLPLIKKSTAPYKVFYKREDIRLPGADKQVYELISRYKKESQKSEVNRI